MIGALEVLLAYGKETYSVPPGLRIGIESSDLPNP